MPVDLKVVRPDPTSLAPSLLIRGSRIPDGYSAVALSGGQVRAPLRLCVLFRNQPDSVAGNLVLLRETADARVLLGCITDATHRLHQWLEIWVQTPHSLGDALPVFRDGLTNASLDARWRRGVEAIDGAAPELTVRTGWEERNPLPLWIDVAKPEPMHPVEATSREAWQLCTDDAKLLAAGLPAYSASTHRYLHLPNSPKDHRFVSTSADAPANDHTAPLESILGERSLVPVNPVAGLMLVRVHSSIGYEPFIEHLGGAPSNTALHGRSPLRVGSPLEATHDPSSGDGSSQGWLFLGRHGRPGRMLESLHLKLRVLADAVSAVRAAVERLRRPLLNVTPDSFQVWCSQPGCALPSLWTARAVLADAGDAVELPLESTDVHYFLPGRPMGSSIYRPDALGHFSEGACTVRIRKVLVDMGGDTIVEGTLSTQERVHAARNDLLRLTAAVGEGRIILYARVESDTALATGELRFRTTAQRLDKAVTQQLQAAEGVSLPKTRFELLPLLGSPVDLFSLAVVAIRTLLVNPQTSLPQAVDEMMSLARQVSHEHDPSVGLRLRLRGIFEQDPRWLAALGPQRLAWESVAPEAAMDLVPPEVWWDVLAMIIRMLPGMGPDSTARDFGDAGLESLHKAFDKAIIDLDSLLLRTRSLVVIDWRFNREIHAVIRGYQTGVADAAPSGAPAPRPAAGAISRRTPPGGHAAVSGQSTMRLPRSPSS